MTHHQSTHDGTMGHHLPGLENTLGPPNAPLIKDTIRSQHEPGSDFDKCRLRRSIGLQRVLLDDLGEQWTIHWCLDILHQERHLLPPCSALAIRCIRLGRADPVWRV